MSYRVSEHAEAHAKAMLDEAEAHRREKPAMDAYPLSGSRNTVVDYGRSGQQIELATAHLREAIPNGQKVRAEMAMRALLLAVEQHRNWMKQKGYDV